MPAVSPGNAQATEVPQLRYAMTNQTVSKRLSGHLVVAALWANSTALFAGSPIELQTGFGFIDTTSGASAALLKSPPRLVIAEEGQAVTYCANDSKFHCFASDSMSFAVPKGTIRNKDWSHDGRIYCVIREYPSNDGSSSRVTNYLIFSGTGTSCSQEAGFDTSAVYSSRYGLRLIHRQAAGKRLLLELYSTDRFGFGSAARN